MSLSNPLTQNPTPTSISRPPLKPTRTQTSSSLSPPLLCFTNSLLAKNGELLPQDLYFSPDTGLITPNYYFRAENVTRVDLGGSVVSGGFVALGVGFGEGLLRREGEGEGLEKEEETLGDALAKIAKDCLSHGITAFYVTLPPSLPRHRYLEILPLLKPRCFPHGGGADFLGVHVEGPFIHDPSPSAFTSATASASKSIPPTTEPSPYLIPSDSQASVELVYGPSNLSPSGAVKLITLAPELPGSIVLIGHLREMYPHIVISLGHTGATYKEALAAVEMGARALTHVFLGMKPLDYREPGVLGLIAGGPVERVGGGAGVWCSVIADGLSVHPAVVSLAFRGGQGRVVLTLDGGGCAPSPGLEEQQQQEKSRGRTVQAPGNPPGSAAGFDQAIRNLVAWSSCNLAEALQCVTENIVGMMSTNLGGGGGDEWFVEEDYKERMEWQGEENAVVVVPDIRKRGMLEPGRRADFVVLSTEGVVEETWMGGERVWKRGEDA